jgi:hypothetical protein
MKGVAMDIIEQEIKKFLDKHGKDEDDKRSMAMDLHFFIRKVIDAHDEMLHPEAYTPTRKNI